MERLQPCSVKCQAMRQKESCGEIAGPMYQTSFCIATYLIFHIMTSMVGGGGGWGGHMCFKSTCESSYVSKTTPSILNLFGTVRNCRRERICLPVIYVCFHFRKIDNLTPLIPLYLHSVCHSSCAVFVKKSLPLLLEADIVQVLQSNTGMPSQTMAGTCRGKGEN